MQDAAKRKDKVLTLPALGDGAKNTIGRFIPNIVVDNRLEYDPSRQRQVPYHVFKKIKKDDEVVPHTSI